MLLFSAKKNKRPKVAKYPLRKVKGKKFTCKIIESSHMKTDVRDFASCDDQDKQFDQDLSYSSSSWSFTHSSSQQIAGYGNFGNVQFSIYCWRLNTVCYKWVSLLSFNVNSILWSNNTHELESWLPANVKTIYFVWMILICIQKLPLLKAATSQMNLQLIFSHWNYNLTSKMT